ncbi:(E2-independent) E3 ubiquitin-conjugating enzyme FATS [Thalassophryne amazonica]|uniref:(E2-independent) E3 ubiquitin-conjugating enzyme FATS n=1 Tax=Thalassophryne amazonica TaxID=390379 RepID=UPI001470C49C|nr:(E2-independent) E3 ubiquitin-conjugating enzyme FATS [Thalassophryne amazonica]XP_034049793.1 (E2-independent) E3 ubiquitin-conjugating enzyme FATS [Thalassophryne amazonica]
MTLRQPAVHLRRAQSWRRSGDDSCWERLISKDEDLTCAVRLPHISRPLSTTEGGRLDDWVQELHQMQSNHLRSPVPGQVQPLSDRTASMPSLDKDQLGTWRQCKSQCFSRGSTPCGTLNLCEGTVGSQESLQVGITAPAQRRGSWERVHIMQTPQKEQTKLSYLDPVKVGWLPVQSVLMMAADDCNQSHLSQSCHQVKLKQPITPTFTKNPATTNKFQDVEVERSHTSPSALGVRSWQGPDRGSPIIKQVPEKQSATAKNGNRPISLQALRRGWNINRFSALPGDSQSNDLPTGTSSNLSENAPLGKTTGFESNNFPMHQTTSAESSSAHILLQRTTGIQPLRATVNSQPISQTTSSVTMIVPQNKAGFSSITISSRKVTRSTSLPDFESPICSNSTPMRKSPSPPRSPQSMDPNSRQISAQKKATIVKVTEQKMTRSTSSKVKDTVQPTSHALDTGVHRRNAAIIKVTEHRKHYSSPKTGSNSGHPEHQESYTKGAYPSDNTPPSHNHLAPERTNPVSPLPKDPEKNGGTLHRSMLNLFVSNPPAVATRSPPEFSSKAVGQRLDRPLRPLSCNANVFGRTEQSVEKVSQASVRKWSFELPPETNVNSVNPENSFISSESAVEEAGQPKAETLKPNENKKERLLLSEEAVKRASTSLTLIKSPDPGSNQSPEDILALNAAAIIENIKLQRQRRKKKSEKDSPASPQGNTEKSTKTNPHQKSIEHQERPRSDFGPLRPDPENLAENISLQEALRRSRPDFIIRSQGRVRKLERRAQERRVLMDSTEPHKQTDADLRLSKVHSTKSKILNDNLRKLTFEASTGKETQLITKRTIPEVKKKKEEEKKREVHTTNRQRVQLFGKKLLDQILQRSDS